MRVYKIYFRNGKNSVAKEVTWHENAVLNGCIYKISIDDAACARFCTSRHASKRLTQLFYSLEKVSPDDNLFDNMLTTFLKLLEAELLRTYKKQGMLVCDDYAIVRLKDKDDPSTYRLIANA